jgi:very-short-patch-repair endonuclease
VGAIEDFVTRCRRKLVDTSMRNRLLNYRPGSRSGSVEIVGEHPAVVWEALVVAKRAMVFRGQPDEESDVEAAALSAFSPGRTADDPAEESLGGPCGDAFAESIEAATEDRHRDNILETRTKESALQKKLLRLSDTARLMLEEQGVATLFLAIGFLRFFEAESSDVERSAALLLIPVVLEREGRDSWRVRMRDDDPIVNPALIEYLKDQHGIVLPELPEALEGYSPLSWYEEVQRLVSATPRWRVSADYIVGIFSFQKFVMHEDLKRNSAILAGHEVIGQLATRSGSGGGRPQLPAEVAALDLDRDFAIEKVPLVVDADSTQLRALAAVARGHHMVIEGPPGTGKSQSIANIVAGALFAGKTVLFVAEKQAALNVVFDRLKKCGLGDFCFEVHSTKANKTAVLKELGRSLDASLIRTPASQFDTAALTRAREELTAYTRAVHEVVQPLSRSAYGVVGRLVALAEAPAARVVLKTDGVSGQEVTRTLELLGALSAAAARVGDPESHAWRDSSRDSFDIDARESIEASLQTLERLAREVEAGLAGASARFGVPPDIPLADAAGLVELADLLDRCPGVETSVAADASWDGEGRRDSLALIERGRALAHAERRASEFFRDGTDLSSLVSAAAMVQSHKHRRLAWLSPSWRRARKTLRAAARASAWGGAAEAANEVHGAQGAAEEREALGRDAAGPRRFGARWRGGDSDWGQLQSLVEWIQAFRATTSRRAIARVAFDVAQQPTPDTSSLRHTSDLCESLRSAWRALGTTVVWPADYWEVRPIRKVCERIGTLVAAPTSYREWREFRSLRGEAERTPAAPIVREAKGRRLRWEDLQRAFERRFYERWLDARAESTPALREFLGVSHAARIEEFRDLDRRILEHHRRALVAQLRTRAQARLQETALADEVRFLRDQLARQRGHKPLRQLLKGACGAIQALKPCFLMSPMTVAQGLDPERHRFDLIVFDEASQMTAEDALGAIVRGKQIVVVGDPKQLPPTNFFAVQSGQVETNGTDGAPEFEDLDSILELATASGFPGATLRWHYRSRHESLIAYSNSNFYNDRPLFTFPGADIDRRVRGLRFEYVEGGIYEGSGVNRVEAQRVVEEVVRHARAHPTVSLGVGTLSLAQQLAVQDELERRRREEPWLEEFLSLDRPEPFFVKNLESIQGDERDVIVLSITYGPGPDGKMRHNFGPINGQNGWRRLNVLTTRARERMLVFSSMRADDIDLTSAKSYGAALLRAFLRYAESDVLEGNPVIEATAGAESPFEAEVGAALERAGVRIQPQVGVSGYRIDIGIIDSDVAGRFVCGVECDGVSYHSAESARDRDRLREEVLKGLGWTLHRIWSLDWWRDRKGQTDRLLGLIAQSKEAARRSGTSPIRGANVQSATAGSGADPRLASPTRDLKAGPRPAARAAPFAPYRMADLRVRREGIIGASPGQIADVMMEALRAEGPVHEVDLRTRTLGAFGQRREGARIAEVLDSGLQELRRRTSVESDGWSWRLRDCSTVARTRRETGIPPERIPSWEFDVAVTLALTENTSLPEDVLLASVRDSFGYGAASAALRDGVLEAIGRLTKAGKIGVGSGGLRLIHDGAAS